MKSIGIIGGIGPQATMSFIEQIHTISQELIPQFAVMGYPPLLVYYHRNPPLKTDEKLVAIEPYQIDPEMLNMIKLVGNQCDLLVITANFPHTFQAEIEAVISAKFVNMIDETMATINPSSGSKIGILGLGYPKVYTDRLTEANISYETLPEELMKELDKSIRNVTEGKNSKKDELVAQKTLEYLNHKGAEKIILGCTELSFLIPDFKANKTLIDPLSILANIVVREAIT